MLLEIRMKEMLNMMSWMVLLVIMTMMMCKTLQMSRKKRKDSVGWFLPYEMMNIK